MHAMKSIMIPKTKRDNTIEERGALVICSMNKIRDDAIEENITMNINLKESFNNFPRRRSIAICF